MSGGATTAEGEVGEVALLRALLRAARAPQPREALREALRALVLLTGAARAYLDVAQPLTQARWTLQHGCTDEDTRFIEAVVSRGIVAAALAAGRTIQSPSAMLDERFSRLRSVQAQQLEAVLCVPMPGRLTGVLYLEGQRGGGHFSAEHQALAEELAAACGPLLERAAEFESGSLDATTKVRERLAAPQLIGRSEALARVLERAAVAAPFDLTVLLTGEAGTGKSELAQVIHQNSRRRTGPFVDLNCAALPESLFESELFGSTAAAFTGARLTAGKVEAADGGTLFLDEIGELSLASQSKLLQLLHSRQYRKLGSNELVTADIRVVAATNAELESLVATRQFREDLFHRLNQMPIRMPSLRERPEDVALLVDRLLPRLAQEHGLPVLAASPALRTRCEINSWPGNIRQLRNSLQVAFITAVTQGAEQVEARHLDDDGGDASEPTSFHAATRAFQRELLRQRLVEAEWNVSEVARQLELTRAHIYNLIRSLKIEFRSPKGAP